MALRAKRIRASQQDAVPQLSCELCHERKVKCDKLDPCTNCRIAGVSCQPVHRRRLPRGRHVRNGSNDNDLRERVQRLEALIVSLDAAGTLSAPGSSTHLANLASNGDTLPNGTVHASPSNIATSSTAQRRRLEDDDRGKYMATHFWRDLVDNVHGLRGVLDQPSDHEDDDDEEAGGGKVNSADQRSKDAISSGLFGIGPRRMQRHGSSTSESLSISDHQMGPRLAQIFFLQVDPIIKIMHKPSLRRLMVEGKRYLSYEDGHPSVELLRSAVCYAAVSSMTEEQCFSTFNASQHALTNEYKEACEAAIERSGLVTSDDITVLQSFVLYLVATRAKNQSRAVWTLLALAIRIAQAMSMNLDDHHASETIFQQQMRRRLWYTLCLLDVHASFDRASKPLIAQNSPHPRLPANVNDDDFDVGSTTELTDRESLTDVTKSMILYHAQAHGKALNFGGIRDPSLSTWEGRGRVAESFEVAATRLLRNCDPNESPYAWYTVVGAKSTIAAMRLHALRPMQVDAHSGAPPKSGLSECYLLELAASLLATERSNRADPRAEGYRWFGMIHHYPLAVALAECYACSDAALVQRYWPIIEATFEHDAHNIADYRNGALWRPMQRLMRKTRERVRTLLAPLNGVNNINALSTSSIAHLRPSMVPFQSVMASTSMPSHPTTSAMPLAGPHPPLILTSPDMSMGGTIDSGLSSPATLSPPANHLWFAQDSCLGLQDAAGGMAGPGAPTLGPLDPAWRVWEGFVHDLSFDDMAGAGFPGSVYDGHGVLDSGCNGV